MHELVDLVLKRTQMFIVSAHVFYLNLCILYHVGTDRHWEAKGSREGGRNTEEDCTVWSREERTGEQDPDGAKADGEGQFQETGANW
jgi:hypothetical protein